MTAASRVPWQQAAPVRRATPARRAASVCRSSRSEGLPPTTISSHRLRHRRTPHRSRRPRRHLRRPRRSHAFVLLAVGLFAAGTAIENVATPLRILLEVARLVLAVVLITVGLAVIYRLGPDRDAPRIRWVSTGAVIATAIWLIASIGFSIHVETFGNYAKTYGRLAAVALML